MEKVYAMAVDQAIGILTSDKRQNNNNNNINRKLERGGNEGEGMTRFQS